MTTARPGFRRDSAMGTLRRFIRLVKHGSARGWGFIDSQTGPEPDLRPEGRL